MSDEVKQTVPGQGEGTPAGQASGETQSREVVKQSQEQASQQGTEKAEPVTAQDLAALEERLGRVIQSTADKRDAKVQARLKEIDSAVAVLRKGGREITEADVKVMKQNAAAEAMIEQEQATVPEGGQPDPLDKNTWDPADPATRKVIDLEVTYGLELNSGMPEAKMIERGKGRIAFIKSYEAALKAAAERQSASKTTSETKPSASPAARIPAQGGTPTPERTGREYLENAHK